MTSGSSPNEYGDRLLYPVNRRRVELADSIVDARSDVGQTQGSYKRDETLGPYIIYGNSGESTVIVEIFH